VWTVLAALEAGQREIATRESADFLRRSEVWTPSTPTEAGLGLLFLGLAREAGGIAQSELERERARWLGLVAATRRRVGARTDPYAKAYPWVVGYAAGAGTRDDALAALAVLPDYQPLPAPGAREGDVDLVIGKVYVLAGQADRGLPYVESAARSCFRLENPFAWVYAQHMLGEAYAARGDRPAALAAYREVLRVWAHAKPRSRRADSARSAIR
jgi:hypothetical protein